MSVVFGLWAFFMTLLGDPGIPKEIYLMKAHPFKKPVRLADSNENGDPLCHDCNVYIIRSREHCSLCNVCIDEVDHHCVFYSKCIGKGNIGYFRMSLVGFVLNMTYFIVIFGFISMRGHHNTVER